MESVVVLDVPFIFGGAETNHLYPVLLQDGQELVLVDCAYPGFVGKLQEAALAASADLDKITKVIITHHDYDHMGSLAELKRTYPRLQVLASALDTPHISGQRKSLRLEQAEALYDSLPEEQKEGARYIQKLFANVEPAAVDRQLSHGELLPWCGGIQVIATPGHMPGHISLYHAGSKTLIAGDALALEDGRLVLANPEYTLDMESALESVRRLMDYEIDTVICYHGGIFRGGVKEALARIGQ